MLILVRYKKEIKFISWYFDFKLCNWLDWLLCYAISDFTMEVICKIISFFRVGFYKLTGRDATERGALGARAPSIISYFVNDMSLNRGGATHLILRLIYLRPLSKLPSCAPAYRVCSKDVLFAEIVYTLELREETSSSYFARPSFIIKN